MKDIVGEELIHKDLGKVKVLGFMERSRTKVEVKVTQRARGWSDDTNKYEVVRTIKNHSNGIGKSLYYKVYNNTHSQFGSKHVCHIKELNKIK